MKRVWSRAGVRVAVLAAAALAAPALARADVHLVLPGQPHHGANAYARTAGAPAPRA